MPHITKCPLCNQRIEFVSSQIGENFICPNCEHKFELPVPIEVEKPIVYNLPEKIEIHVCNKLNLPIKIENIIISLERGYIAGPFFTNKEGVIKITKKMLEDEEKDWISSGGGDYRNFSLISNLIINVLSKEMIDIWINARKETWNLLLDHEKKYWKNIDELINVMKFSNNYRVKPVSFIVNLTNLKGNEEIVLRLKTEFELDDRQKMIISIFSTIGVIVGICVVNYKSFSIRDLLISLFVSLFIIASLSLFFIHTKIGRKIDKNKTRDAYDKLFPPKYTQQPFPFTP